jgi:large subunit ribosomal protein L18
MQKLTSKDKRKLRVRARAKKLQSDRPRLTVHRTGRHIYAQIIDDKAGHTLAAASTLDTSLRDGKTATVEAAKAVGKLLAERGVAVGVSEARFDRGGVIFHGRVRAVAEGAREGGLVF